jgi:flagellar protein FliO/FliZ
MFAEILRVIAALALTLGLIGVGVVVLRRFGPETLRRLQSARADRRLRVIETLVLDPARRLVLVRCDGEERLILLGGGRVVPLSSRPAEPAK